METFVKMISYPKYESVRNIISLILTRVLISFQKKFNGEDAIKIFDFYLENFNEKFIQTFDESIKSLSKLFGEYEEFAFHVFEFLQNNAPNPVAFRSFD